MQSVEKHFKDVEALVRSSYDLARAAKKNGFDPVRDVEVPLANSLAERVVGLVSVLYPQIFDERIIKRIAELEKTFGSLDPAVALSIAEEIAKEKFCKFENHLQALEAGIRVAIGYMTLGYVSSPIEGFIQLKIKKTKDGKDFIAPYYSGPIRSAGGTEAAFSLVVVDYLREIFGYAIYDPTEDEIKRGIQECYEYHERITNLQYLPSEREIEFLMKNLPIQLTGDPSEDKEVYNYKDLPRVETNFIRSGYALVMGEGIAQKAPKILNRILKLQEKGFKLSAWNWMKDFVDLQKRIKSEKKTGGSRAGATYMQDLVAGRPVFAHPSISGGFRLRYGRSRNTGYSTLSIHPATMGITNGFIAIGTQLRIEKPTKGCTVSSCDSIDGPIVKLRNGGVRKVLTYEESVKIYPDVEEIIYLGDILVPYGDFLNRNHPLEKQGYIEQYWLEELRGKGGESPLHIRLEEAIEISEKYKISLHPEFIYYWKEIEREEFIALIDWISRGEFREDVFVIPYGASEKERFFNAKRALEIIGCPHELVLGNVVLKKDEARKLLFNFGIENCDKFTEEMEKVFLKVKAESGDTLSILNKLCRFGIRDKTGTFIGARMGRPEKAKLRKLIGSPHVLFPVGEEGGRLRSFQAALDVGYIKSNFPCFYCKTCNEEKVYAVCDKCRNETEKRYYCPDCDITHPTKCEEHGKGYDYTERRIDSRDYFERAKKRARVSSDEIKIVKGVRGTSNKDHSCEDLAKGLLRAKYNLHVNKDGTIRYDMTEMPLTHFKPKEIGASVSKLKELGYEKDVNGIELTNDEQILEIFPHDIVLPACPETPDEKADDVFLNVSRFIDDELENLYGVKKYFGAQKREDLIGMLMGCMAPHTASTVVGRVIGFSKIQAMLASPYIHAAMRRDCLGFGSYVQVQEGGLWKVHKIGEFIERNNLNERADSYGTLKKSMKGVKTWSNPGAKEVSEITKHPPSELVKVSLEDGRSIEVTRNHRLYLKGKKEVRAEELQEGDRVMVGYKKDIEEIKCEEVSLASLFSGRSDVMIRHIRKYLSQFEKMNLHENFAFRDSFPLSLVEEILRRHGKGTEDLPVEARISAKRDCVELPIKVFLDKDILEVFGLYAAEGYGRKRTQGKGLYQIGIAGNEEVKSFVKRVIQNHFEIAPSYENKDQVTYSSRLIYELFVDILGMGAGAKHKRIPSLVLNLTKEKLSAFLRGYYEGDGSVSARDIRVTCDSVSEGLKHDLSFALSRFGIFTRFYEYEKRPGPRVRAFYEKKKRAIPSFRITKIIIPSDFVVRFKEIGFLSERKKKILESICERNPYGMKIPYDDKYVYPKVVSLESLPEQATYCFQVAEEHNFFANDLLVHNCDGDEAAVMLLMDLLLNFSKKYLSSHRGATQDAPLVLNVRIRANEVDDMIFDVDVTKKIPLELYQAGEEHKSPSEVKMERVKNRLGGDREFVDLHYSYETSNLNNGPLCSSYKTLPTMYDKVDHMMILCKKLRAVDVSDVARLVIERHFVRDIRGNLRKFSQQTFRCVKCNEIFRRPPLSGKCTECGGRLIFTISEGSILKYMQPALDLARTYKVSPYLIESLELTEMYIQSIFGREKEKQETITKWF